MTITYHLNEEQIKQLYLLYQGVWWGKERTIEEARECVKGSQLCIGILDTNNNLIAFTRVITDFTFKAVIFDVIVSEAFRGKGYGEKLINLVKNHDKLNKVKHFDLYCLPDVEGFYQGIGFSSEVGGVKLMRYNRH